MNSRLSVLVTPRDGLHYQEFLYRGVERAGVRVHYTKGPTPSQTANLLLAPLVLLWFRVRGVRVLHIHWVFQFSLPWARNKKWARRLMEWWFGLYLRTAGILGYKIAWTAHDLLPHENIFANDVRARDLLIAKASVVFALSEATAGELRKLGAHQVRVIPMGSYSEPYTISLSDSEARSSFGFDPDDVVVSLIGRIEPYKGADLLLRAASELPSSSKIKVLIAGLCSDGTYRAELDRLASDLGKRAVSAYQWVPDDDLARYFQASDFAAFPFREITNSASVLLAQSFGKPVVIPDLPTLRDIPDDAAIRFSSEKDSLLIALRQLENLSKERYREMSAACVAWATKSDWSVAANDTIAAYRMLRGADNARSST
jgi:glycosyltransferase involved in cell wall biosynthesis